jgi:acylphosphatase
MTLKRYDAVFSGRVQGVGFRYTVLSLAQEFKDLTGYVKNLPDGGVEVVVEGDETTLNEFLHRIKGSSLSRWIFDTKVDSFPIHNRHHAGFRIHV